MILTSKIRKALQVAAKQHDGQKRKDKVTPFIIHPVEVALIVSQYTKDEDIISAALLHDVIEDTSGYSTGDMRREFGDKVAEIVLTLTDVQDKSLSWDDLHRQSLKRIKDGGDDSILVALADKYTNISTKEIKSERAWYYQEILNIAKDRELTKNTNLIKAYERLLKNN